MGPVITLDALATLFTEGSSPLRVCEQIPQRSPVPNLFLDRNASLTTLAGLEGITSVDLPDNDDWSPANPSSGSSR